MTERLSIHQPQYLPWIPYFQKILQTDQFVYLDNVQFQKNGVQNRNQIKTPNGPQWLTVPVKQSMGQTIQETEISNVRILEKHLKSLRMNYSKAPYFEEVRKILEPVLTPEHTSLCQLNIDTTNAILEYLEYHGKILISSELDAEGSGSDLILDICQKLETPEYLSGQGGKNYMDLQAFEAAGISVCFQRFNRFEYPQLFPKVDFVGDLSILDLLFNCGKSSIELISKAQLDPEFSNQKNPSK